MSADRRGSEFSFQPTTFTGKDGVQKTAILYNKSPADSLSIAGHGKSNGVLANTYTDGGSKFDVVIGGIEFQQINTELAFQLTKLYFVCPDKFATLCKQLPFQKYDGGPNVGIMPHEANTLINKISKDAWGTQWANASQEVMRQLMIMRYSQNPDLLDSLPTGAEFIEDTADRDANWGVVDIDSVKRAESFPVTRGERTPPFKCPYIVITDKQSGSSNIYPRDTKTGKVDMSKQLQPYRNVGGRQLYGENLQGEALKQAVVAARTIKDGSKPNAFGGDLQHLTGNCDSVRLFPAVASDSKLGRAAGAGSGGGAVAKPLTTLHTPPPPSPPRVKESKSSIPRLEKAKRTSERTATAYEEVMILSKTIEDCFESAFGKNGEGGGFVTGDKDGVKLARVAASRLPMQNTILIFKHKVDNDGAWKSEVLKEKDPSLSGLPLLPPLFPSTATHLFRGAAFDDYKATGSDRIAQVNFANAEHYGGDTFGRVGVQEEQLIRQTMLGLTLAAYQKYKPKEHNLGENFFKCGDEGGEPTLLMNVLYAGREGESNAKAADEVKTLEGGEKITKCLVSTDIAKHFVANELRIAAPNLKKSGAADYNPNTPDTAKQLFLTAYRGFKTCADNGITTIASGAWGAGVFGNNLNLSVAMQLLAARVAGIEIIFSEYEKGQYKDFEGELAYGSPQVTKSLYLHLTNIITEKDLTNEDKITSIYALIYKHQKMKAGDKDKRYILKEPEEKKAASGGGVLVVGKSAGASKGSGGGSVDSNPATSAETYFSNAAVKLRLTGPSGKYPFEHSGIGNVEIDAMVDSAIGSRIKTEGDTLKIKMFAFIANEKPADFTSGGGNYRTQHEDFYNGQLKVIKDAITTAKTAATKKPIEITFPYELIGDSGALHWVMGKIEFDGLGNINVSCFDPGEYYDGKKKDYKIPAVDALNVCKLVGLVGDSAIVTGQEFTEGEYGARQIQHTVSYVGADKSLGGLYHRPQNTLLYGDVGDNGSRVDKKINQCCGLCVAHYMVEGVGGTKRVEDMAAHFEKSAKANVEVAKAPKIVIPATVAKHGAKTTTTTTTPTTKDYKLKPISELVDMRIHPLYQTHKAIETAGGLGGGKSIVDVYKTTSDKQPIKKSRDGEEATIGDLHGNALKLVFFLAERGFIDFEDKSSSVAGGKKQTSAEIYAEFAKIYQDGLPIKNADCVTDIRETSEAIKKFEAFLAKITVTKEGEKAMFRLIGDVLCDRGQNDYFTLQILKKVEELKLRYEVIFSNHDHRFFESYQHLGDSVKAVKDQEQFARAYNNRVSFIGKLKYIKQALDSKEEPNIDDLEICKKHLEIYTGDEVDIAKVNRHIEQLNEFIKRDSSVYYSNIFYTDLLYNAGDSMVRLYDTIVDSEEHASDLLKKTIEAANAYKSKHLKLLSYTLSADEKHITIHCHAPVDLTTIFEAAVKLKVDVEGKTKMPEDPKEMADLIDKMNVAFSAEISNGNLSEMMKLADAEEEEAIFKTFQRGEKFYCDEMPLAISNPVYAMCWRRDGEDRKRREVTKADYRTLNLRIELANNHRALIASGGEDVGKHKSNLLTEEKKIADLLEKKTLVILPQYSKNISLVHGHDGNGFSSQHEITNLDNSLGKERGYSGRPSEQSLSGRYTITTEVGALRVAEKSPIIARVAPKVLAPHSLISGGGVLTIPDATITSSGDGGGNDDENMGDGDETPPPIDEVTDSKHIFPISDKEIDTTADRIAGEVVSDLRGEIDATFPPRLILPRTSGIIDSKAACFGAEVDLTIDLSVAKRSVEELLLVAQDASEDLIKDVTMGDEAEAEKKRQRVAALQETEAASRAAEAEASRRAAEAARKKAAEEAARKKAAEEAESARKKTEEDSRKTAEEEGKEREEATRRAAEADAAARKKAEEASRTKAEADAAARTKAAEEAAARTKAAEEAAARKIADEAAAKKIAEEATRKAEALRKIAEEEEHIKITPELSEKFKQRLEFATQVVFRIEASNPNRTEENRRAVYATFLRAITKFNEAENRDADSLWKSFTTPEKVVFVAMISGDNISGLANLNSDQQDEIKDGAFAKAIAELTTGKILTELKTLLIAQGESYNEEFDKSAKDDGKEYAKKLEKYRDEMAKKVTDKDKSASSLTKPEIPSSKPIPKWCGVLRQLSRATEHH
jgi:hypothetical protein